MAKYPHAEQRPLPNRKDGDGSPRGAMPRHNILCFHTMVDDLQGAENFFRGGQIDAHFGVGGAHDPAGKDGHVVQWIDTSIRANANLDGSPEIVSIETSDGARSPVPPWSEKQIDALVKLGAWVCEKHDIPPVLINGTRPGTRGIGYHRQGVDKSHFHTAKGWPLDQWRVDGGVRWSGHVGKVCPGDARIKQLVNIVIPRIKAELEGQQKEWWEMPIPKEELKRIAEAVRDVNADPADENGNSIGVFVRSAFKNANQANDAVARLERQVAALREAVAKL